jgi:hypothetical protein
MSRVERRTLRLAGRYEYKYEYKWVLNAAM